MRKLFAIFFILVSLSCFSQNVPTKTSFDQIIEIVHTFSKMSTNLDKLHYRLADGKSMFGFFLADKIEIPFTMEANTDYIFLAATYGEQNLKTTLTNGSDRITLTQAESKKIYIKYHSPVNKEISISMECSDLQEPTATVLMIFCRDKNAIALPYDDIISSLRVLNDSNECYHRKLSMRLPYFLIAGTCKSKQGMTYAFPPKIADSNVCYNVHTTNKSTRNKKESYGYDNSFLPLTEGLYFVITKSKTVETVSAIVKCGNGINYKAKSSYENNGIVSFNHNFNKKGPYQLQAVNDSSLALEHGLLFITIFDK